MAAQVWKLSQAAQAKAHICFCPVTTNAYMILFHLHYFYKLFSLYLIVNITAQICELPQAALAKASIFYLYIFSIYIDRTTR
jgi:hypothetical protein